MVEFDNRFTLRLELQAQSPMIHFQSRQTGATIRASEVKPKLDRFLLDKLRKETGVDDARTAIGKDAFLPSTDEKQPSALRYKMQIFCESAPMIVVINNEGNSIQYFEKFKENKEAYHNVPPYPLYYGNGGIKSREELRLGILSDPVVVIRCFNEKLRKLIEQYVEEFFLVTNFGTMRNKGFGSFAPKDFVKGRTLTEDQRRQVGAYLTEMTGTPCYCMTVDSGESDHTRQFKCIESFYRLMKSGYNNPFNDEYERSFLVQYMHDFLIGNEKAWMKRQGISPNVRRSTTPPASRVNDGRERYIRAFLGTSDAVKYKNFPEARRKDDFTVVSIKNKNGNLERVPSPVFFKIIGDTVFIAAFPVDDRLYGQSFSFASYMGTDTLLTPEKSDFDKGNFDISDFMAQYVAHYNKLRKERILPQYLRGSVEVKRL